MCTQPSRDKPTTEFPSTATEGNFHSGCCCCCSFVTSFSLLCCCCCCCSIHTTTTNQLQQPFYNTRETSSPPSFCYRSLFLFLSLATHRSRNLSLCCVLSPRIERKELQRGPSVLCSCIRCLLCCCCCCCCYVSIHAEEFLPLTISMRTEAAVAIVVSPMSCSLPDVTSSSLSEPLGPPRTRGFYYNIRCFSTCSTQ